jgi:hypothetical protein
MNCIYYTKLRERDIYIYILFARNPVAPVIKTVLPSRNCMMLPNSIRNRSRKFQSEMFASMKSKDSDDIW